MIYLLFITVYLFALILIGVWKSRLVKTQADFAVAGRSLSPWVLTGTMLATWIGTGSILGNAGKTYEIGISAFILPLGGVLGIAVLTAIAGKVRAYEKMTVPEIVGARYGPMARLLSVVALVTAYLVIVSYQYNAGGAVLHTVLADDNGTSWLSLEWATVVAAVFIIAYTMLAGLLGVAYTDVANGVIILGGFIIALPLLWVQAGGWTGLQALFTEMNQAEHLDFGATISFTDAINFCLPPFLLVLGDANMYQRFSAATSHQSATRATALLILGVAVAEVVIIACAWVASAMLPDAADGRHVLIHAAHQLLPTGLGALLLTTMVGIIISTADSYLLAPATSLVRDVYLLHVNPKASEKHIVLASRAIVLLLGLLAFAVSKGFAQSTTFFEKALYAYTIYGAAITPALVAAFFWRKASAPGAIASIVGGTVTTLLWEELSLLPRWMPVEVDAVVPGIIVSIMCLVIGSRLGAR